MQATPRNLVFTRLYAHSNELVSRQTKHHIWYDVHQEIFSSHEQRTQHSSKNGANSSLRTQSTSSFQMLKISRTVLAAHSDRWSGGNIFELDCNYVNGGRFPLSRNRNILPITKINLLQTVAHALFSTKQKNHSRDYVFGIANMHE